MTLLMPPHVNAMRQTKASERARHKRRRARKAELKGS